MNIAWNNLLLGLAEVFQQELSNSERSMFLIDYRVVVCTIGICFDYTNSADWCQVRICTQSICTIRHSYDV
jgi:hypothetical protein